MKKMLRPEQCGRRENGSEKEENWVKKWTNQMRQIMRSKDKTNDCEEKQVWNPIEWNEMHQQTKINSYPERGKWPKETNEKKRTKSGWEEIKEHDEQIDAKMMTNV